MHFRKIVKKDKHEYNGKVYDLCVDENARHEGIGTALYGYVLEYAKSIGCHNVTLNVWEGNDSAIKFYENIGMKIQKVSMEQIL